MMSSGLVGLMILVSIFMMCQCLPRPWGTPPAGAPRLAFENSGSSLCRVICSRLCCGLGIRYNAGSGDPRKDVVCPPECAFTDLDMFNKRSYRVNRGRSFGDISFDDYLFMKLLGRNLGDRD